MAEQIFISYRRSDAGGHAGRLHDRLSQWFDAGVVFYDLDAIEAGAVFPVRLAEALDAAVVVLVLIGPDWVTELNRRAGAAEVDFVRHEVERALARRAAAGRPCVIPVLFGGATAPAVTALEAPLRAALAPLCELDMHAFHGKNADWNNQFVRLRALIAAAPGVPVPRWRAPDGVDRPFHLIGNRLSPHFHDPTGLLERLHDSLSASGRTAVLAPAAIYGMGGVGKTQLALKYSHSYRDQYAGVWWLRAQTPEGLQLDAQACCQAAGAPLPDRVAPTQALNAWLQRQEHAWLLVYDNAESLESLHEHLPEAGPHHVLITSRDPAWGSLAAPLQAGTWTGEQGADFLIERCGPIAARDHRDVWQALADALGGLPLALEQAAGYLEATAMQAGEYLELLGAARHSAALLDYGRIATGYEASVGATLALAFERLRPATRQLLGLLAWCAPEPVPERLFVGGADLLSGELAEAASDVIAWNDVVQELRRYGIADRVVGAAPALQLHRLTLNVARHRSIGAEREVRTLTALLGKLLPRAPESPVHWPLYARLLPHVQQLAEREFAPEGLAEPVELLLYVAQYLRAGPALYAQSRRIEERLVAMCREKLGEEHADTLTSINNLAVTLSAQGDLAAARALQESVLEVRRRVLGEEHPDTLRSMNNLAATLSDQGERAAALALQGSVLEVRRRVLGEEHPDTLTSMNNLALTLSHQGDRAAARALQESVLEVHRRVLGEEHPDTLRSMNNLAATLSNQDDRAAARALQESVLEVHRRVLGEEHPDTLRSMNNLAATLFAEGDRAAARSLLESVLEVHQRALGEEHPHTLKSLGNLAATLWRLGDLAGARQLEERALQTRQRTLGDAHPDTLLAMHNLAYTLRDLGDRDGARQLAEQALAGRRHALGDHHPDTQSTAALAAGLGSETPVPAPGGDPASSSDGRIRQSIGTSLLTFLRRLLG